MNYYFYGSNDKYKGSYLKKLNDDYVGQLDAIDDHFFDEAHNYQNIYAYRERLSLALVKKLRFVYVGSLDELL